MEVETPPWEQLDEREEYAALVRQRLEHLVPVTGPLVLSSQIQRSGGTLLSQLFDGHPECHAHPHEIKIGWPREANWPPLDLDRPGEWFERLFEKKALTHFVEGYQKRGAKLEAKSYPSYDVFPFLFLPRLQKAIFDARAAGATSERDVLDAYFTSYFNAWLDNQSLYTGPKKVVTGFTPRLAMDAENRDKFFAAYPDGKELSCEACRTCGYHERAEADSALPYFEGVEKVGAQRFVVNRAHRAEQKEFSLVANLF